MELGTAALPGARALCWQAAWLPLAPGTAWHPRSLPEPWQASAEGLCPNELLTGLCGARLAPAGLTPAPSIQD